MEANTKQPEVLSINVGENIKTGEKMGPGNGNIFPNPKNDPNIGGVASIVNQEQMMRICPLALSESIRLNKPIILIVKGIK